MPKFSIIIPVYNVEAYLVECLDSVFCQTFTDWECIIVNDGSTDHSYDIARDYIESHKLPITNHQSPIVLLSQQNAGVAAARNFGVAHSSGDYICFLDADDWWAPLYLERMAELIGRYPDAGLYSCRYWYVKNGRNEDRIRNLVFLDSDAAQPQYGLIDYSLSYYRGAAMPVCTDCALMRRSLFDEMGGFPLGIRLGEDFLLWAKIALQYPVAYYNVPLAYYLNDIPVSLRATRRLHAPERTMYAHLDELDAFASVQNRTSWLLLKDKLRLSGLRGYWLDKRYHDYAVQELQKVDLSRQPSSVVRWFRTPLWQLRLLWWRWRECLVHLRHRVLYPFSYYFSSFAFFASRAWRAAV